MTLAKFPLGLDLFVFSPKKTGFGFPFDLGEGKSARKRRGAIGNPLENRRCLKFYLVMGSAGVGPYFFHSSEPAKSAVCRDNYLPTPYIQSLGESFASVSKSAWPNFGQQVIPDPSARIDMSSSLGDPVKEWK